MGTRTELVLTRSRICRKPGPPALIRREGPAAGAKGGTLEISIRCFQQETDRRCFRSLRGRGTSVSAEVQMRSIMTLLIVVALSTGAPPSLSASADENAMQHFRAASDERLKCLGDWEVRLTSSSDPIDYVADAVLKMCAEEVTKADKAAKAAMPALSWADITATHETLRKGIIARLVVRRAARSADVTTAAIANEPPAEPKTREGKLARCDADDAEWREWTSERGFVRADQIDEHLRAIGECKAAAAKLPMAADYHAQKP